jgi:GTP:adenosylcobinamide-phosphate guanylyltransferase
VTYTALVLAGSRPGRDAFAEAFGTDLKALIPLAGEPMVARPVRVLLASENVGEVIVFGPASCRLADAVPSDPRLQFRESGDSIASTILALCDDPSTRWPLLVTTADHVLLDTAMVDEFCRSAEGADIAIGVVERKALLQRLPETQRTWLKFRGGAYTGANLFALKSPDVRPAIEQWRAVEQDRKKAWRIMSLLGPAALLLVALRLVSLDEVLAQLSGRLGLRLKAVKLSNPLAGVDVDKPEDHALAEAILKSEGPKSRSSRAQSRDAAPGVSTSLDTNGSGHGGA